MGGNPNSRRKPTTFGRVLTNSSHVRSDVRYRARTHDLSGGRTSLRRLSHLSPCIVYTMHMRYIILSIYLYHTPFTNYQAYKVLYVSCSVYHYITACTVLLNVYYYLQICKNEGVTRYFSRFLGRSGSCYPFTSNQFAFTWRCSG